MVSCDTVQLAAGSCNSKCLGIGTVLINDIELTDSAHVEELDDRFVSVVHKCDFKKVVVFTKSEAVILTLENSALLVKKWSQKPIEI